MTAVKLDQQIRKQDLDDRMDAVENQKLSEWDQKLLAIQDSSQNALVTKMSLIAEYNIFLGAWERHCAKLQYSQLYELWKWGKHVSDVIGMDDLEVLFPGGWRFELADLLDQFAK